MPTERLHYFDSHRREFRAHVLELSADGRIAYLDRSAFYPASGGQPFDTGVISGVPVIEVRDEGERVAHCLAAAAPWAPCSEVEGHIDWKRRFDHMQQHSGQHLLSAVLEQASLRTVSFHLGESASTIDLETDSISADTVRAAEQRANELVFENRTVHISFREADYDLALRKPSERKGVLRIISIEGLDQSACGGTHVRSTAEIGPILIRKLEKVRQAMRLEFVCGLRAVRRARADYEALSRIAQTLSTGLDDAPARIAAQAETMRDNDKSRRALESDLARYRGRELYDSIAPDSSGLRRHVHRLAQGSLEELRSLAQSFTAHPKSVFVGILETPPSVLLAVSPDAGIDAGRTLKAVVTGAGGRGGGNAGMAQGSVPGDASLEKVIENLLSTT